MLRHTTTGLSPSPSRRELRDSSSSPALADLHSSDSAQQLPHAYMQHMMSDPLLSMRQHPTNEEVAGGPTAKSLNKMVINIESSQDRHEWLYVAHDTTYHPNRT